MAGPFEQASKDRDLVLEFARRLAAAPPPVDGDADALLLHEALTDVGRLLLETAEHIDVSKAPAEYWSNLAAKTSFDDAFAEYESDPTVENLKAALNLRLQALESLHPFTILRGEPDPEQLSQAATSFRRSAAQLIRGVERDVMEVQAQVQKVRDSISAAAGEQESLVKGLQTDVTQLDARLTATRDQVVAQVATADQELAAQQTAREAAFTEWLEMQQATYDQTLQEARQQASVQAEEARAGADSLVKELRTLRDDATTIYESVGAGIQADSYGKQADAEKKQADRWRILGLVLVVATVALGFLMLLLDIPDTNSALQYLLGKIGITAVLVAAAAYAFSEAGKHRNRADEYRRIQVDLFSIGPYLALFPGTEANNIKIAMAKRLFAGGMSLDSDEAITEVDA